MPKPADLPQARFEVELKQQLAAGGDFYDVIPFGEGVVDYLVADASGHSLGASYWTAALKALLGAYASPVIDPIDILCAVNTGLRRVLPNGAFFTLIYARLDRDNHRLSLANAGHPPAIMTLGQTRETAIIRQEGDVIGAFSDAEFGVAELTVHPGDRFFLYSDGVVESNGQTLTGVNRLATACRSRMGMPLAEVLPAAIVEVATVTTDDVVLLGVDV
jgi:sigma-B regulation protein RsbU (phosphoserine phosphatase)